MNPLRLAILTTALMTPTLSGAADNPDSHQHGMAALQLAIDGARVDLRFQSPAYNLLGFEHAPENDEQRARVTALIEWMEATPLVQDDNRNCRLESSTVEAGSPGRSGHHGHHDGNYREHYREHHGSYPEEGQQGHHGEHHGTQGGAHHNGKHQGSGHDDGHSDIVVAQSLTCAGLDAETTLSTPLMTEYPAIEQLGVQWVGGAGQGAVRLEAGQDSFQLGQ